MSDADRHRMGLVDVGDRLPALAVRLTRADLVRYAGASTDFNPIHYSDHFAAKVGLPGVVAHGMLTMGLALRVVTQWIGDPSRVLSYSTKFTKPVVVPDGPEGTLVEFSGVVSAVADGVATVTIEATCNGQKVLGAARAEVALTSRVDAGTHQGDTAGTHQADTAGTHQGDTAGTHQGDTAGTHQGDT